MSRRRVGCVAGLFVAAGVGTLFAAGTASAAPVVAAPQCAVPVSGAIGSTLAISGKAVSPAVLAAANKNNTFLSGVNPGQLSQETVALGNIPVGATVQNAASTTVPASQVATAVTNALKNAQGYGGLLGIGNKRDAILKDVTTNLTVPTGACTLVAHATNFRSPSSGTTGQPNPSQPGPQGGGGSGQSGNPSAHGNGPVNPAQIGNLPDAISTNPGGLDIGALLANARQAPRDYGNIPLAGAGQFTPSPNQKYGEGIPGSAPSFGQLGQGNQGKQGGDPIRTAGQAQALGNQQGGTIGLPMLLAVIAFAGVTAALIRTWVLRKLPS